jgi:hypothetical protein
MVGLIRAFPTEIQVNAVTTGDQLDPVGLSFLNGSTMFAYETPGVTIRENLFGSDFVRTGATQTLSPAGTEQDPAATLLANVAGQTPNRGIIVWSEVTGVSTTLFERIVDQNGNLLTAALPLTSFAAPTTIADADIAAFSGTSGRSVVTYTLNVAGGSEILARTLQADGTTTLVTKVVTPTIAFGAQRSTVATLTNGNYVVAWDDLDNTGVNPDTSGRGIHAKIFSVDGIQQGNEFTVNVITTGSQTNAKIATLSSGDFAITWVDPSHLADSGQLADPSVTAIKARVFHADGTPVTGELSVNTSTLNSQFDPSIAADNNGNFVIAWTDASGNLDTSVTGIVAQAFSGAGDKIGSEFLVNQATSGTQNHVDLSSRADGSILAVFQDNSAQVQGAQTPDTSGFGIQADVLRIDLGSAPPPTTHVISQVFRFFDSATGDHFYTLSAAEANQIRTTLPTFHDEGSPWGTPDPGADTLPVFRFFDTANGSHFLTTSAIERDFILGHTPSLHFEGQGFNTFAAPGAGTITLERFFNTLTGNHHLSASAAETASLHTTTAIQQGWVDEGAGFIVHA